MAAALFQGTSRASIPSPRRERGGGRGLGRGAASTASPTQSFMGSTFNSPNPKSPAQRPPYELPATGYRSPLSSGVGPATGPAGLLLSDEGEDDDEVLSQDSDVEKSGKARCGKWCSSVLHIFFPDWTPILMLLTLVLIVLLLGFVHAAEGRQPFFIFYGLYVGLSTALLLVILTIRFLWVTVFGTWITESASKVWPVLSSVLDPESTYLAFTIALTIFWRNALVVVEAPPAHQIIPLSTARKYFLSSEASPNNPHVVQYVLGGFTQWRISAEIGDYDILYRTQLVLIIWATRNLVLRIVMFYFLVGFLQNINANLVKFLTLYSLVRKLNANWIRLTPVIQELANPPLLPQSPSLSVGPTRQPSDVSAPMADLFPAFAGHDKEQPTWGQGLSSQITAAPARGAQSFNRMSSVATETPQLLEAPSRTFQGNAAGLRRASTLHASQVVDELLQAEAQTREQKQSRQLGSRPPGELPFQRLRSIVAGSETAPRRGSQEKKLKERYQVEFDGRALPPIMLRENIEETQTSGITNLLAVQYVCQVPVILFVRGVRIELHSKSLAKLAAQRLFEELIEFRNAVAPDEALTAEELDAHVKESVRQTAELQNFYIRRQSTANVSGSRTFMRGPGMSRISNDAAARSSNAGEDVDSVSPSGVTRRSGGGQSLLPPAIPVPRPTAPDILFGGDTPNASPTGRPAAASTPALGGGNEQAGKTTTTSNKRSSPPAHNPNAATGPRNSDTGASVTAAGTTPSQFAPATAGFLGGQRGGIPSVEVLSDRTVNVGGGHLVNVHTGHSDGAASAPPDAGLGARSGSDLYEISVLSPATLTKRGSDNIRSRDSDRVSEDLPTRGVLRHRDDPYHGTSPPPVLKTDGPAVPLRRLSLGAGQLVDDTAHRSYLTREIFELFMGDQVDQFMKYVDIGGRDRVSMTEFTRMIIDLYQFRKQLVALVQSQKDIRKVFRRMVAIFLTFIAVLVFLVAVGVSANTIIISGAASLSSITVALSFLYSGFIQSVMFVCFLNPYNVSDRVRIDNELMIVKKVSTYFTEFITVPWNKPRFCNHITLYNTNIINESRSRNAGLEVPLKFAYDTAPEKYEALHQYVGHYVNSRAEFVKDSCFCIMTDAVVGHYIQITYWITCTESWHAWKSVYATRSRLLAGIARQCLALGITYRKPTLPVLMPPGAHLTDGANAAGAGDSTGGSYGHNARHTNGLGKGNETYLHDKVGGYSTMPRKGVAYGAGAEVETRHRRVPVRDR